MTRRFSSVSFEREARWLIVLTVVVPLLLALMTVVIPGLWRLWGK